MRGKRAKAIRKLVYGENYSPRFRIYSVTDKGTILADQKRGEYQIAKRYWKEGK